MKANGKFFHVVLFSMLRKVVLILSLWMEPWCATIKMKATGQYVHVVLFIMLYKVALTFNAVDKTLV